MPRKFRDPDEIWAKWTPEQRKKAMELVRKEERENRVLVEDKNGAMFGMTESEYRASLKKNK